jgi:alpha-beta hydrolase superfamily lysophospholipase
MPDELHVKDADGLTTVALRWLPVRSPRAVVHVMHGWGEHAMRYDRLAKRLTDAGIAVYADDHRGHGRTGQVNGATGDLGPGGMGGVVEAVHAVSERATGAHPGAPFFALGHSWGSMILGRYLRTWSDELDGALLTGTTYRAVGGTAPTNLNERFEPARTPYDWLSRDAAEVDAYVADPMCGFEVMRGRPTADDDARLIDNPIRPSLPVLIFNGGDDPVGGAEGGRLLAEHYRGLGLTDVTLAVYDGARHELFNEVNRDEVTADVLAWLEARI